MATIPIKTGIPQAISNDLASSIDFHITTTNFLSAASEYGDFLNLSHQWNKTFSSPDPITAQAQFFKKLNNDRFDGTVEGKSTRLNFPGDYDVIQLNTYLHPNEVWVRDAANQPQRKEEGGDVLYNAFNLTTGDERWIEVSSNLPTSSTVESKLSKLEPQFGAGMMTDNAQEEFLLYWFDKYKTAHSKVKETYKKYITDETENYFTDLSDSIGLLQRATEVTYANSIPFTDIEFEVLKTIPSVSSAVMNDKLDSETQSLLLESSKIVNTLFRMNLIRVIEKISTQDAAHGDNLMADRLHWIRMSESLGLVGGIISTTLGNVYKLLAFMQISQSKEKARSPRFEIVLSNSKIEVDFLKNKIETLTSSLAGPSNNQILKAEVMDFPDQL